MHSKVTNGNVYAIHTKDLKLDFQPLEMSTKWNNIWEINKLLRSAC